MEPRNWLLALAGGTLLWLASSAMPGQDAAAQCCSPPPPPPCCTPPAPPPCCTPPSPPPRPPSPPGCCSGGGRTNIIVNSNAVAVAVSGAGAGASVYYGGGGGGSYIGPGPTGMIQGLDVEGLRRTRQVAYEATRTKTKRVVIQAFCLDDRSIPHPASQVFPDRDVEEAYEGELYRCIAGTRMQITIADFNERISFEGGQTMTCAKGEALFRRRGAAGEAGELVCRPQAPARDCNERSLLRRFGAGIKVLTIVTIEKYTAYREEVITESSSSSMSMSLDGGVGGVVY